MKSIIIKSKTPIKSKDASQTSQQSQQTPKSTQTKPGIIHSFIRLKPIERLAVTLSFTLTGLVGLYWIGKQNDLFNQPPSLQTIESNKIETNDTSTEPKSFLEFIVKKAKEDWERDFKTSKK